MRSDTNRAEVELGVNVELAARCEDMINEGVGGGESVEKLELEESCKPDQGRVGQNGSGRQSLNERYAEGSGAVRSSRSRRPFLFLMLGVGWFERHPHYHIYSTPINAYWLNRVEHFFLGMVHGHIRGVFHSVRALVEAIEAHVGAHDQSRGPFV